MQTITTKYLGPTGRRGSRIKATCEAGSVTVPYDYDERDGGHYTAFVALVKKLGWDTYGRWYKGETKGGCVFVCSPKYACTSVNII